MNTGAPVIPQPGGRGGAAASNHAGAVNGPPVTLASSTQAASITKLRTEVNVLSNPNPLGAASELVDYALLEGPDGTTIRVRTLYDTGATDSMLDYKLARFFHHTEEVEYVAKGVNSVKTF